jgi:uncharacterized protein (TIGR00290 family)
MKVIASWSGGKDSCLAVHRAIQQGHQVATLLNFVSKKSKRCCFHGVEGKLMEAQSRLVGIPMIQKEVTDDMKMYEQEFKSAVGKIKQNEGIEGMVFGDIYLDEHYEWVKRVCGDLGIRAIEPLWGVPSADVVGEFVGLGFKAIVVSCQSKLFGREFVGRYVDEVFIRELAEKNICPCGENGEFHTLVVDGPLFSQRIEVEKAEPVLKQGFWEHWFLDIREWKVVDK